MNIDYEKQIGAAIELPAGWTILIGVEKGAGYVDELRDPEMSANNPEFDGDLSEQIIEAVEFAKAKAEATDGR